MRRPEGGTIENESFSRLKAILASIFEMDKSDLDFGIYRVMNAKREELTRFLEEDLASQVESAFSGHQEIQRVKIEQELTEAIQSAKTLGVDPEATELVIKLRTKLSEAPDMAEEVNEVYSHLSTFFNRYYIDGDFISQRRYKSNVYAIPYEGEEVKMYWANIDQYYIKSSERFRNYNFSLGQHNMSVRFVLSEAGTEKDDQINLATAERRFVLNTENPFSISDNLLQVNFKYVPDVHKQSKINDITVRAILEAKHIDNTWKGLLLQRSPTDNNSDRTLLEKHINAYTARNTTDYFIHKDLGAFLSREIEYYIKNEMFFLDDIESMTTSSSESTIRKIKSFRTIGGKIIRALAQIEDFQRKLWTKKKFVTECNYCLTLDIIAKDFHNEIISCDAQWEEWCDLGFLQEKNIRGKKNRVAVIQKHPLMAIDTRHFSRNFVDRLIVSIDDFDEKIDGVLIHSENYQALSLLAAKYAEKIDCIYIDPPYNTSEESFLYKNLYKHSSWLSMIHSRATVSRDFLTQNGIFIVAIDDEELYRLKLCMDNVFGSHSYIGTVVVQGKPSGRSNSSHYATSHDYFLAYAISPEESYIVNQPLSEVEQSSYMYEDDQSKYRWLQFRRGGGLSTPDERPNSEFAMYYSPDDNKIIGVGGRRTRDYPSMYESDSVYRFSTTNNEGGG